MDGVWCAHAAVLADIQMPEKSPAETETAERWDCKFLEAVVTNFL